MTDPYQVLGIGPASNDAEIRRRDSELVRRHPPDRDPARFAAVREAYEKLRDPVERLKSKLFDVESSETMDAVLADVKKRLRVPNSHGNPAILGGATMSGWPDEERILTNFRQWLEQARTEAVAAGENGEPVDGQVASGSVGLYQLVEELTALRHEVKLGTKSARNLEQQAGEVVGALEQAIQQFRSVEASEVAAAERAARPFVEAVIDLDESLRRGRTVIETARQRILEESAKCVEDKLNQTYQQQWFLRRWLTRRLYRAVGDVLKEQTEDVHRNILDSLVAGFELILNRLHRVMKEQEIYRMECVGKPVDPNSMTVIEVVEDSIGPPGLVVEEVRPGYYWKARTFRYAEVRAIRAQPSS